MPLRICRNQRILFVREVSGHSIAMHGFGTEVKTILMTCPVLDDLLPRAALPPRPGTYIWQGTLIEERDPGCEPVQTRYWVGTLVALTKSDLTRVFDEFGDPDSAGQILTAAMHAATQLEQAEQE